MIIAHVLSSSLSCVMMHMHAQIQKCTFARHNLVMIDIAIFIVYAITACDFYGKC